MDNSLERAIVDIQYAALDAEGLGCISKEIGFQQAWSILLRSQQLKKEAEGRPVISREQKSKQMDICWNKKSRHIRVKRS